MTSTIQSHKNHQGHKGQERCNQLGQRDISNTWPNFGHGILRRLCPYLVADVQQHLYNVSKDKLLATDYVYLTWGVASNLPSEITLP
jgi:hypothetical protein